jgi:hypothetical protein
LHSLQQDERERLQALQALLRASEASAGERAVPRG